MNSLNRTIIHFDLDTFFVSVERLLNSKLNDKLTERAEEKGQVTLLIVLIMLSTKDIKTNDSINYNGNIRGDCVP